MPTRRIPRVTVTGVLLACALAGSVSACVTPRRRAALSPAATADSLARLVEASQGKAVNRAGAQDGSSDWTRPEESRARRGADSTLDAESREVAVSGARTGDSTAGLAESEPVPLPAPEPAPVPLWDLEVEEHASRARVTYFVDAFSGRLHGTFERALSRQTRYSGLIADRLRAAGLPQDLTYLPLIESWYDPHAYSKAAAVGMWQFMTRTARGVGLRVDWWVDERRDPVRATEGAVRLLASLKDEFGSLFLAAAAYNGGSGRVSRGLTQFASRIDGVEGESKFFALSDTRYLRPETRDYVPKLIAAALVARQPERYGFSVDSVAPFGYDSVLAPGGAPLAAVAAAAVVAIDSIRDLNPHLIRGMVPEGPPMWVRVPVGFADGFDSLYESLDSATRTSVTRVTTKSGESMASIARRHKITTKQINWYNPAARRLKNGNLVAGQKIVVPSRDVVAAARDVPNPAIERYPVRRRASAPVRTASKPGNPPAKSAPAKSAPAKSAPAKSAPAKSAPAKSGTKTPAR